MSDDCFPSLSSVAGLSSAAGLDLKEQLDAADRDATRRQISAADIPIDRELSGYGPTGRPSALVWLALLPEWTDALAVELGLVSSERVAGYLRDLKSAGLIEQRTGLTPKGRRCRVFWIRAGIRANVGRYLRETMADRMIDMQYGQLVDELRGRSDIVELGLVPWLDLAIGYRKNRQAYDLVDTAHRMVESGQLATAIQLVGAATVVGDIVGPPLSDAVRRARWRIDRAHRAERDERFLRHFVRWGDVDSALSALFTTPTRHWAVHLKGMAGVGKTMVIRYLASGRFAADHGRSAGFPVARVDFDHLDPRYPEQRPGDLVLAFMDELLGFAVATRADRAHRRLQGTIDHLHEELEREQPLRMRIDELRNDMAEQFAEFIETLPSPQVLVLDTCEELAKSYAPGSSAPAIERTFELMEVLHEKCPSLRVVFAGRRWLVPPPDGDPRAAAEPRLEPRDYLRVVPLGDLSLTDAERYLDLRQRDSDAPLRAELRGAILNIVSRGGESYNPFELNAYCDWATTDSGLTADALGYGGHDPYIERRIIGRIDATEVKAALPVALAFGHFDVELIAPALQRHGIDPQLAFDGLASQEWVTTRSVGPNGRPCVLEISEPLLDRMRRVVCGERPIEAQALGRDAEGVIDSCRSLGELPRETVECAVRMLSVEAAAELWARIDARLLGERQWGWAYEVATYTAATENERAAISVDSPTILAAIHATQTVARRHSGHADDLAPIWREVQRLAQRHPLPAMREMLRIRAELGIIAAGESSMPIYRADLAGAPPDAAVGVLEGLTARGARGSFAYDGVLGVIADRYAGTPIGVAAAVVRAIAVGLVNPNVARSLAEAAEVAARALDPAALGGSVFADWSPAPGLIHRCRLVRILSRAGTLDVDGDEWENWWAQAANDRDDIDAERLLSAMLLHDLASGKPQRGRVFTLARYVPGRTATHWLHRNVPPLIVAAVESSDYTADPSRTLAELDKYEAAATYAGNDPDGIEACQLTRLRLARRHRTLAYADVRRLAQSGTPLVQAEAWLVLTLVEGERPDSPVEAGSFYGWWRCGGSANGDTPESEAGIPQIASLATRCEVTTRESPTIPPWTNLDVLSPATYTEAVRARIAVIPSDTDVILRQLDIGEGFHTLGRALFEVGEVIALRDPARGYAVLMAALGVLTRAGQPTLALRAGILAGLALRRYDNTSDLAEAANVVRRYADGGRIETGVTHPESGPDPADLLVESPGWLIRWQVVNDATGALTRLPRIPKSAEFELPRSTTSARSRVTEAILRLTSDGVLLRLVAGAATVAVYALVSGVGFVSGPSSAFLGGLIAAILGALILPSALNTVTRYPHSLRVTVDRHARWRAVTARPWFFNGKFGRSDIATEAEGSARIDSIRRPQAASFLDRLRCQSALRAWGRRPAVLALTLDAAASTDRVDWERALSVGVRPHRVSALLWYRRTPAVFPQFSGLWSRGIFCGPSRMASSVPATRKPEPLVNYTYRLVHLVGTPVDTVAGMQLRIRDDLATESSSRVSDGELLVSVVPLARQSMVVVLQADPDEIQPFDDLRETFVRCARSAVEAGAGAVFVVPPVHTYAGTGLVTIIWDWLDRKPAPTPLDLLRLLHKLKRAVAAATTMDVAHPEQSVVMDVLLFMRTR